MKDKAILGALLRAEQTVDPDERCDAVQELMNYFCVEVEREGRPDRAVLEYFARSFREYLDGKSLSVALGLTMKGRPAEDHTMRDAKLAVEVLLCKQKGNTNDEAFELVSEKYPELKEDTVKSA